jgi:hypothetical protein
MKIQTLLSWQETFRQRLGAQTQDWRQLPWFAGRGGKLPDLLIVPSGDAVVVVTGSGQRRVLAGCVEEQSGALDCLAAEMSQWLQHTDCRARAALLALPRCQVAFKRLEIPACAPEFVKDMIRYQMDQRLSGLARNGYYDFWELPGQATSKLRPYGLAIASREVVDPWRAALAGAGIELAGVTTSSHLRIGTHPPSLGCTLFVSTHASGTELTVADNGRIVLSHLIEHVSDEPVEVPRLRADWIRLRVGHPELQMIHRVVLVGAAAHASGKWLAKQFQPAPEVAICDDLDDEQLWTLSQETRVGLQACNLLRHVEQPAASVLLRKRRRTWAAGLVLLGLLGVWGADARLRWLDREIARQTQHVRENQLQLQRATHLQATHALLAERQRQRPDWLLELERLFAPLGDEQPVRLTAVRAEVDRDSGTAEIRLSGSAADSAAVTRMLELYAAPGAAVDVTPLSLRPQRDRDGGAIHFDLRASRRHHFTDAGE